MGSQQLITLLLIVNQIESQPELEMIPPSRDSCIKCSGGACIWNAFIEAEECTQVNKVEVDDACCE